MTISNDKSDDKSDQNQIRNPDAIYLETNQPEIKESEGSRSEMNKTQQANDASFSNERDLSHIYRLFLFILGLEDTLRYHSVPYVTNYL